VAFRDACRFLLAAGRAYRCRCSRQARGSGAYPDSCRDFAVPASATARARLRVPRGPVIHTDLREGIVATDVLADSGDFVIWRVEDLPSFHLAAVVDDALLGVNEIVRGGDLRDSAPRQRALQTSLGLPEPRYLHLPVAIDALGQKLSKQNLAPAVDTDSPACALALALDWLGHPPPPELRGAPVRPLLDWAISSWSPSRLPTDAQRPAPSPPGSPAA
jgi:glutamyl-Q tRNA(Asp) synthetase